MGCYVVAAPDAILRYFFNSEDRLYEVISDMEPIPIGVHRVVVNVIVADNHEILVLARWYWASGAFLRKWDSEAVGGWICCSFAFFDCWHAMLIHLEVCIKHGILVLPLRLLSLRSIQSFVWQVLVVVIDEGLEILNLDHLPAILAVLYQWVDLKRLVCVLS